ncbi:hypothetical protein JCM10213_008699 [Rhodosporidiobolus nylandii]
MPSPQAVSITPMDPTSWMYKSPSPPVSPNYARARSPSPAPKLVEVQRPSSPSPSPSPEPELVLAAVVQRQRTPSPSPSPEPEPQPERLTPAQKRARTIAAKKAGTYVAPEQAKAKKALGVKAVELKPEPEAEEGKRATRSSGKAEYFQPLEGAPKTKGGARSPKKAAPAPRKRYVESEDDQSEEEEEVVVVAKSPAKKARTSHLPSPARSNASASSPSSSRTSTVIPDSDASDDDNMARSSSPQPPARKRATRIAKLPLPPPSPASTPKKERVAYSYTSPNKPKVSSPLKKAARRAAVSLSESEAEAEDAPAAEEEAMDVEEDEFALPTPSSSTPRKASATPSTTPTRKRPASVTPSRSSSRIQRLPASVADIENAPASLRSRLVGFHMEDEGYGVSPTTADDSEEDEESEDEEVVRRRREKKGKAKAVDQDALFDEEQEDEEMRAVSDAEEEEPLPLFSAALPLTPSSLPSSYASFPLHLHLTSALSVLTGARLPTPFLAADATSTLPPKSVGTMGFPFLEGGYDEWERPLRGALEEVITNGMGNAVMLLGPRGAGKTMIIDRTLSILGYVHGENAFATVRLSGLVHTTDRLALRSIAVQLQQQGFGGGEFEVEEGDYSSNSATMTTLLRLLEPSSSTAASAGSSTGSATAVAKSKPLVLIIDEFDLFAQHPRQSFLYCLLDIVQGNRRRGGVAVVGVSSRVDCLSLLEKRVRSRCQSHVLQVMPSNSLSAFTALGQRLMKADERAWELERGSGAEGKAWAEEWNKEVERFWGEKKVEAYMERVWTVYGNVPTELRSVLAHLFFTLDYRSRLSPTSSVPRLTYDLLKALPRSDDKDRDPVLRTLSTVELTALVGCKHLAASTADRQTGFNFEMLYDSYVQHAKRASASGGAHGVGVKSYSKAAMREAFDTLRSHELLLPRSSSSTTSSTSTAGVGGQVTVPSLSYLSPCARDPFRLYRFVPWAKDVDREVEARGNECPLGVRRWCKNWLD